MEPPRLVVLDSLVALHRADENDAGEVRYLVKRIRVAAGQDATLLLLAHEPEHASKVRGSTDWENVADSVLSLVRTDVKGWRKLSLAKQRDHDEEAHVLFQVRMEFDGHLSMTAGTPSAEERGAMGGKASKRDTAAASSRTPSTSPRRWWTGPASRSATPPACSTSTRTTTECATLSGLWPRSSPPRSGRPRRAGDDPL
jgi:hypothetical protein